MPRWQIEVKHSGLDKSRIITGNDQLGVERKAAEQKAAWDKEWLASLRTQMARAEIQALQTVLAEAVTSGPDLDWDSLKMTEPFPEPPPPTAPPEPRPNDLVSQFSWLTRLVTPRAERERKFRQAREEWLATKSRSDNLASDWETRKQRFLETQTAFNGTIEKMQSAYQEGRKLPHNDGDAGILNCVIAMLTFYCWRATLQNHKGLITEFELDFIPESATFVIDCSLPAPADMPTLKEVRYVASRDAFDEVKLRPAEVNQIYDDLIYQICLRALYVIFLFETPLVKAAVFNGWVTFADPATGNDRRACILSVQAEREAFAGINLERVDPRACFRALKGVGSAKLHGMVPVAPILRGNREDPRFVESIEVADRIREGTNLAAIGWEDFEHLIREIFEKEFKAAGGEVRVTRASRDWGVDAVVFDPDPIRGGKIVIQAKRYTNTVEVSAVRDLYGTVVNEGATKGILVTTSAFGPESYAFAKDKPLTLLDGSNLLHLLERHGHRAHIDLAEAKRLNLAPLARSVAN